MARRSRRRRGLIDAATGIVLTVVGVIGIGALVAGFQWVKSTKIALDPDTNCPAKGPHAVHVIMFDRSDPISGQQAQRIRQVVERVKNDAPFGERFDLYAFEGDVSHALEPVLRICAPGRPEDANQWIANPEQIKRRYETRFTAVLDRTLDQLLQTSTQGTSPIIESIRGAAITSFGPYEQGEIPLRITLISDMVQNTTLNNHFKIEPNFQQLSHSSAWSSLQPHLKGADADILYLIRPSARRGNSLIQSRGHQQFWEQLISASGGRLNTIEPI
jgi:hypothetical protein